MNAFANLQSKNRCTSAARLLLIVFFTGALIACGGGGGSSGGGSGSGSGGGSTNGNSQPTFQLSDGQVIDAGSGVVRIPVGEDSSLSLIHI